MYRSAHFRTFVLLLASTALYSTASANCSNYAASPNRVNSDGGPYTTSGRQRRVSLGLNCTGDAVGTQPPSDGQFSGPTMCEADQCWVATPANYFVDSGSILNVSTPNEETYNSIMQLVQSSISDRRDVDWNGTVAYPITTAPFGDCIDERSNAYISFVPFLLCTEGILSGCSGDGPSDNTPITACGSILLSNGQFDGEFVTVQTGSTFNETESTSAPPNATVPDNSDNVPGNVAVGMHSMGLGGYLMTWIIVTAGSMLLL